MRPHQRFVALRPFDNQVAVMRHWVREQLVGHCTALLNALHGHLSKIGHVAAQSAQIGVADVVEAGFEALCDPAGTQVKVLVGGQR